VARERKPLFTAVTPLAGLSEVTLFEDTWYDHIVRKHIYMAGKESLVRPSVLRPTVIVPGTSNLAYVVFVNLAERSPAGSPLTVVVDPLQRVICTALYNRTFKTITTEGALWLPSPIE
jgi:hypothetical protein